MEYQNDSLTNTQNDLINHRLAELQRRANAVEMAKSMGGKTLEVLHSGPKGAGVVDYLDLEQEAANLLSGGVLGRVAKIDNSDDYITKYNFYHNGVARDNGFPVISLKSVEENNRKVAQQAATILENGFVIQRLERENLELQNIISIGESKLLKVIEILTNWVEGE